MGTRVKVVLGNICPYECVAIVNAANGMMSHGAGVAKAIADKAGIRMTMECNMAITNNGAVAVGDNIVTKSYDITTCKYIIHVVGPHFGKYTLETARKLLLKTYKNLFKRADQRRFSSIALPLISAGITL